MDVTTLDGSTPASPPEAWVAGILEQWVIYKRPPDYPHHFIARRWLIAADAQECDEEIFTAHSLKQIRMRIPPGLVKMDRLDGDDPSIVEVWLVPSA
jgi:hypothetical protein